MGNCKVIHAETDANVLIATTAIACSQQNDTVLMGGDTDLLILLSARVNTLLYRPSGNNQGLTKRIHHVVGM